LNDTREEILEKLLGLRVTLVPASIQAGIVKITGQSTHSNVRTAFAIAVAHMVLANQRGSADAAAPATSIAPTLLVGAIGIAAT